MTDAEDVFDVTELSPEREGWDFRITLSYMDRTGAKDRITVRVYKGDDFTPYSFNVADQQARECYYDSSSGEPRPSVAAMRALAEAGWTVTNFSIEELQDKEREQAHTTLSDIFDTNEDLYFAIYNNDLSDEGQDELNMDVAVDASAAPVRRLALGAGVRTQILRWIVDAEDSFGAPFSEMMESDDVDVYGAFEGDLSFSDERHMAETMELFGELMGEAMPLDYEPEVSGLSDPVASNAVERGIERGRARRRDKNE